ncbi:helix-turn-helix transcriptional regulator [Arthrobacter livingstonensis]|uniref:Helix-turn-helix transcriptional regulator n=1 Tax=Arthrobacter livingstonensis TaxID=670078 RepID=A0A2V5LQS9_9MICC|nr:response regulator transcription factor [Arthrobacter livingstonensis]PYI65037.1 helix-turn-helix transcriptional regulator [Arthrobacter livingstonensis]
MDSLRIALVDDYEIVLRGLEMMLRSYGDTLEVVELDLNRNVDKPVDLTLYDTFAATPGDGKEVNELASNPLAGKVVIYSWDLNEARVKAALANGASGYLSKGLPAARLVRAIHEIHRGEGQVFQGPGHQAKTSLGDWPGREEGLTQREAEVLALITQGLNNAEIADRARLSVNTVKTFIRSCYRRIGVTNRSNAILWGLEHGFFPDHKRVRPRQ